MDYKKYSEELEKIIDAITLPDHRRITVDAFVKQAKEKAEGMTVAKNAIVTHRKENIMITREEELQQFAEKETKGLYLDRHNLIQIIYDEIIEYYTNEGYDTSSYTNDKYERSDKK